MAGTEAGKAALNAVYQIEGLEVVDDTFYDEFRVYFGSHRRGCDHPGQITFIFSKEERESSLPLFIALAPGNTPMLRIENLTKVYPTGTQALKDVSFEVPDGEFLAVIGLSAARANPPCCVASIA